MLFYPIELKVPARDSGNGHVWVKKGWITGPIHEALTILNIFAQGLIFRLGHPTTGIGMAEDWLCPKCQHDHIIKWESATPYGSYSCPKCLNGVKKC